MVIFHSSCQKIDEKSSENENISFNLSNISFFFCLKKRHVYIGVGTLKLVPIFCLTYFWQMFPFYTPLKTPEILWVFFRVSRGNKMDYWQEVD